MSSEDLAAGVETTHQLRRDAWQPAAGCVLSSVELEQILAPMFPHSRVLNSDIARGGLSNTNVKVQLADRPAPILVRFYCRDALSAQKEFKLNQLVRELLPVPRYFGFSPDNSVTGHPFCVMEWVEAERLEQVVPRLRSDEHRALGKNLGRAMAAMHQFVFDQAGFLDENLQIDQPIDVGAGGLKEFIQSCLQTQLVEQRLGRELTTGLLQFAEQQGPLLQEWEWPPCLTHADFGGSNILVSCSADEWRVAAILDWEFAFSGMPYFDFGNLLRPGLGSVKPFVDGIEAGYRESGGSLPSQWLKISRIADLSAWAEFLTRADPGETLIEDARAMISSTIEQFRN